MIGSTIKNGARQYNSNVINAIVRNATFNAGTNAHGARDNAPEHFQKLKVRVKLPFQRNPNFCGRDDILRELHRILHRPKTLELGNDSAMETIALEYAQRFGSCYTSIFWIDANDSSRTTDSAGKVVEQLVEYYAHKWRSAPDYQEIANILGIPGKIDPSGQNNPGCDGVGDGGGPYLASGGQKPRMLLLIDNKDKAVSGDSDKLLPTCNWGSEHDFQKKVSG
ncbi:hypothetical protein RUND412_003601 [Rhizina undulata]